MYQYRYCVTTARKIDRIQKYAFEIERCAEQFNVVSQHAKNYKHIILPIEYEQENMLFVLESEHDLGSDPSLRPLWLFSKFLLEIEGLKDYCINKRFLKPVMIKRWNAENTAVKLSDRDILKCLIDIYLQDGNQSGYMKRLNQELKEEINQLLVRYLSKAE